MKCICPVQAQPLFPRAAQLFILRKICIQCFQQYLISGKKLTAKLCPQSLQNIFPLPEVLRRLLREIHRNHIKEFSQPALPELTRALRQNTRMQPPEIVRVIFLCAPCIQLRIVRAAAAHQRKALVNGPLPENLSLSVSLHDFPMAGVQPVFIIIAEQKKNNRQNVKAAGFAVPVAELRHLLLRPLITLQHLHHQPHLLKRLRRRPQVFRTDPDDPARGHNHPDPCKQIKTVLPRSPRQILLSRQIRQIPLLPADFYGFQHPVRFQVPDQPLRLRPLAGETAFQFIFRIPHLLPDRT